MTSRYLYSNTIDEVLARLEDDQGIQDLAWYLADRLGSVRQQVQADGTVLNQITYDSFGNILSETNPAEGDRFKYTGREYDDLTGLYYYRARWYDAGTGKFLSEDPLGFAAGDYNLSRYVGNDPLNSLDPSGLSKKRGLGTGNAINTVVPRLDKEQHRYWLIIFADTNLNRATAGGWAQLGHVWIGIYDNQTKELIVRGFYPRNSSQAKQGLPCPGTIVDDSKRTFTVARAYPIDKQKHNLLKRQLMNAGGSPPSYDLHDYNCATFAISTARQVGQLTGVQPDTINLAPANNDATKDDYTPWSVAIHLRTFSPPGSILFDAKEKRK